MYQYQSTYIDDPPSTTITTPIYTLATHELSPSSQIEVCSFAVKGV